MSQELEEQQRLTYELKDQLRSKEAERVRITQQIKIIEAKLLVQELQEKIRVETEETNQLRAKKQELEERLKSHRETAVFKVQSQVEPIQDESQNAKI